MSESILAVEGLSVSLQAGGGVVHPVRGVTFSIRRGEIVGMAGESGSGKTLTALAIARLLPRNASADAARLTLAGHDLLSESDRELRPLLGTELGMVFQDPMASLNPARRIGTQMIEGVRAHRGLGRGAALALAERSLADMHIPAPRRRLRQHAHELSGGMCQRTMLAMAMMSEPALLIADEPTTALDVTVQAQVMTLIRKLNEEHGTAVLLISHNLALLSEICECVIVMYAGHVVEVLPVDRQLAEPKHPYTRALMAAVPDLGADRERPLAAVGGAPASAADGVLGCPFAPRCPLAEERCRRERPPLFEDPGGHRFACWVTAGDRDRA